MAPDEANSLQISVKTGKLDPAGAETGSPMTPRTASYSIRHQPDHPQGRTAAARDLHRQCDNEGAGGG